jgi:hypothetical protein
LEVPGHFPDNPRTKDHRVIELLCRILRTTPLEAAENMDRAPRDFPTIRAIPCHPPFPSNPASGSTTALTGPERLEM